MGKATHENYQSAKDRGLSHNSVIQQTISTSKNKTPTNFALNSLNSMSARKM